MASGSRLPGERLLEIQAVFAATTFGVYGLDVFGGLVTLRYNTSSLEFIIGGAAVVPIAGGMSAPHHIATYLKLREGESLKVHVYIDGSVVEAIANGRAPIAANVLPPADADLSLVAAGATLVTVDVWHLHPSVSF